MHFLDFQVIFAFLRTFLRFFTALQSQPYLSYMFKHQTNNFIKKSQAHPDESLLKSLQKPGLTQLEKYYKNKPRPDPKKNAKTLIKSGVVLFF